MNVSRAFGWSLLGEIASRAISPLVLIVLARLLSPEDFGVVAAATIVVSFSQVFWEAGVGKALVQFKGDVAAAANVGFWINVALGFFVAAVLVMVAGVVAEHVFHDARVAAVLRLMSAQVVFSSLSAVHTALLQKEMQFQQLFKVRILTTAAPALLSIPFAVGGMGLWALVWGSIFGQLIQALVLWKMAPWRPRLNFDPGLARRLVGFSSWVVVSGLAGWFYLWADSLIVGIHLGAHEMGLYRTGNAFIIMLVSTLVAPMLPVLYSHLSRVQGGQEEVRRILGDVVRLIAVVTVPISFLIYALARPISDIVFGPTWEGVNEVIAVMALTHGFAWIVGANGEAYRAIGRPQFEAMIMLGTLPFYCIVYWISVRYGLHTFLWARLGTALFGIAVQLWAVRVVLGFPVAKCLGGVAQIAICSAPILAVVAVRDRVQPGVLGEITVVGMALLITGALIWRTEASRLAPLIMKFLGRR